MAPLVDFVLKAASVVAAVWIVGQCAAAPPHYDETDDVDNGARSGMILYTDHGTGCQYLGGGFFKGGITPRLGPDGAHIGCRQ